MPTYGVVTSGFIPKTLDVIIAEMQAEAQLQFGSDVDLTETSPLQKFIEVIALESARTWEMAEALYYSGFLDTASGASLDRVVRLLSLYRKAADIASGTVTFTGIIGATVPEDFIVETTTGIRFRTTEAKTFVTGSVDVAVDAIYPGVEGNVAAGTITHIVSSNSSIYTVTNAVATTGGTDRETDDELRDRALQALSSIGNATLEAIRQAVLAITGVDSVGISENLTTHLVSLVVDGKTPPNAEVDTAINDTRAAGISVVWAAVSKINIYVLVTASTQGTVPSDAATQIKTAILNYINDLEVSEDVIYLKVVDVIYNVGDWVYDITNLKVDIVNPPLASVNVAITPAQRAITDLTYIGVTLI